MLMLDLSNDWVAFICFSCSWELVVVVVDVVDDDDVVVCCWQYLLYQVEFWHLNESIMSDSH